jgi:hypothetical protein
MPATALAVQHGHVVDVVARHQQQRVEMRGGEVDAQWRERGDLHHRTGRIQARGQRPVAQVPVGDQAEQVLVLEQQQRRHPGVAHGLRGLQHGGRRSGSVTAGRRSKRADGGGQQIEVGVTRRYSGSPQPMHSLCAGRGCMNQPKRRDARRYRRTTSAVGKPGHLGWPRPAVASQAAASVERRCTRAPISSPAQERDAARLLRGPG